MGEEAPQERRWESKRGEEKERIEGGGESGNILNVIAEWGESGCSRGGVGEGDLGEVIEGKVGEEEMARLRLNCSFHYYYCFHYYYWYHWKYH